MKKYISVLLGATGFLFGAVTIGRLAGKSAKKWKEMSDKHLTLMLLFDQWMAVKQSGKDLKEYFHEKGYEKIVIYGMSYVGKRLAEELSDSNIEIVAAIDRNAKSVFADVPVITLDEDIPECDCVVVTAVYYFEEIEETLEKKVLCPVVSLEDILYEI